MTANRLRLVIIDDRDSLDSEVLDALAASFDIIPADDPESLRSPRDTFILLPAIARTLLSSVGEGLGVVHRDRGIVWANKRLDQFEDAIREEFTEACKSGIELYEHAPTDPHAPPAAHRLAFSVQDRHFEVVVSPVPGREDNEVHAVVGVLWEVTAARQMQNTIDAIDAAGSELLGIEPAQIKAMNMSQRLQLLENKIITSVRDVLNFDNFEVRLLDKNSNRLELVISVGIRPLKIGEVMYAEETGQGISGRVAVTGESYLCKSVRMDPIYRDGMDNAGSSLTVPLRLHDRIVGVFNIESDAENAFDDNDRLFAEVYGRYVAMAMNILDLLVVERYTTNEQAANVVLREIDEPLNRLAADLDALAESHTDDAELGAAIADMRSGLNDIRERVQSSASGPQNILDAEQEMQKSEPDPALTGKRVLIADDESAIREGVRALLSQKGCIVTACATGAETMAELDNSAEKIHFDLVISDIKMPDHSGYEIFNYTKTISDDIPVILMTGFGYDPHHSIIRASQEGLQGFLFKPFQASQLIEAIEKVFVS